MLGFVVSSHAMYAPLTLPVLLPSLSAAGIGPERVFVVVCGTRNEGTLETRRGTLWFVNHQSRTFAAFIEVLRRGGQGEGEMGRQGDGETRRWGEFEHWFVLNDTCKVGPEFGRLAEGTTVVRRRRRRRICRGCRCTRRRSWGRTAWNF